MKISHQTLEFQTKGEFDFIDFTNEVEKFVSASQIKNGLVNLQTMHTTASLFLNENEPLLLEDFKKHLSQISPKSAAYRHNEPLTYATANAKTAILTAKLCIFPQISF